MKTLNVKFIALLAFILATGFVCNAQDAWKHPRFNADSTAKRQTEMMKKELTLTNDQITKVEEVNLRYAKKNQQLMDEMRKQMQAIHQEKEKEMEGILSKDQMEKYKQMRPQHHGKHHPHKGGKNSDKKCKSGKGCKSK